jgi:hypothetical protein
MLLAERWLRTEMQAENLRGFVSREDARDFIEERLLRFYRMRATAGVP